MTDQLFAITDIETTGGGISGNRVTEICIVLYKNGSVQDKYISLVNPQCPIPRYITTLTGIDNETVANAPSFRDIAKTIDHFTKDAIFVAHNVSFDYNVLRHEFRNLGMDFTRRKLCTVRLSRKLIPGLLSYSLGRLCKTINIPLENRHRAEGDTDATVILFSRLLSLDADGKVFFSFLNPHSKEATIPPQIPRDQIENLPEIAGVYLFKDATHKILYAGKAKNIKKRVLSHFYEKKTKKYLLGQETHFIDYETTNNELLALLLESEKIRQHYPKFNRAQKRPTSAFQIIHYINQRGIIQLALQKIKVSRNSAATFYNRTEALNALEELCEKFKLCPRFCTLQPNAVECSHYRLVSCEGICRDKESVPDYNQKVREALSSLQIQQPSFAIHGKGRTRDEIGFALVVKGVYKGFGFFDSDVGIQNLSDYEAFLKPQKSSYHTHSIIRSYIKKHGERQVVYYDSNDSESISEELF